MGLWVVDIIDIYTQEGNNITEFLKDRVFFLRLVFMGVILLLVMRFTPGGILPEKNKEL